MMVLYSSPISILNIYLEKTRSTFNNSAQFNFNKCDDLFKKRKMGLFWNNIRKAKGQQGINLDSISLESLEDYFKDTFLYDQRSESDAVSSARSRVAQKLKASNNCYTDFIFSEHLMKKFIYSLKPGCAPGTDGITSEQI